MNMCRGCGYTELTRVLDLGRVPAQKYFPPVTEAVSQEESPHSLAMNLCLNCGLAQLAGDDTVTEEKGGLEPQAVLDQAEEAIKVLADAGWLDGATVREFASPHGGSWLPLVRAHGLVEVDTDADVADVVLDCFGVMHEPDQRRAFELRAAKTAPNGVLLMQFHSLAAIVGQHQWNALRHGHFAYHSLTALSRLLAPVGMNVATTWEFDLYGGTVLAAAVHGDVLPDERTLHLLRREAEMGITSPEVVGALQQSADDHAGRLRVWLENEAAAGRRVYGYGAASKAVPLLSHARIDRRLLVAVADASPAKQGCRMPGTDIPIISPQELVAADPDNVLLFLPDLFAEVCRRHPELESRLTLGPQMIHRTG
jgi:hypothetical protein